MRLSVYSSLFAMSKQLRVYWASCDRHDPKYLDLAADDDLGRSQSRVDQTLDDPRIVIRKHAMRRYYFLKIKLGQISHLSPSIWSDEQFYFATSTKAFPLRCLVPCWGKINHNQR